MAGPVSTWESKETTIQVQRGLSHLNHTRDKDDTDYGLEIRRI